MLSTVLIYSEVHFCKLLQTLAINNQSGLGQVLCTIDVLTYNWLIVRLTYDWLIVKFAY